ncbi:MAG: pitrilysin family protein [Candidatus Marinimicrobia bacterium]|nr:pitrilysin family protein [Candidatus Neomarinimicrobiota bacterium]MDP7059423.1 pitrilysin family protein [Candidatus Neomarinimicrobiota bacterium]
MSKTPKQFVLEKKLAGITEYRHKKNNLTVLLLENHHAPVITFMVTYRVGSRNEAVGHTGSTHLLEHLMFKGSEQFNKERGTAIWNVLQDVGAMINATTWFDRTNYFELLPKEHLEKAVEIEADRMRGAFIKEKDRQSEMTVVRNEFDRGENDPWEALDKNIWATAYQAHPYHHATIGWRSDIENVPTKQLKKFYNTFYWPNNATVSVVGDFQKDTTLTLLDKHFGPIPMPSHEIPQMHTSEPPQEGPRRVLVKRAGEMPIVGLAHKTPEGVHEDTYSLQILGRILGYGKTSRFYRKFIDPGKAVDVSVWSHPLHDNGLFVTYVFLTDNSTCEEIEKDILEEYAAIITNGVKEKELRQAKAQIRAETAFTRDGSYSVASNLNEAIALGDWTFYATFLERIEKVSCKDVHRVASSYLKEDQSTTGFFIPTSKRLNAE